MSKIMLTEPRGTQEFRSGTDGSFWYDKMHTVTYARYATLAEAERDLAELKRGGFDPRRFHAWIEGI